MLYRTDVKDARRSRIHLAYSDDGRHFSRSEANPVLSPGEPYDAGGCEDPRVVKFGETYYLTYVGDRTPSHQEQCLATSTDLVHWEKKGVILTGPSWGDSQVKAAVIAPEKIGGHYVMYFIAEKIAWRPSMGLAVSDDLLHWSQPLDHPIMQARPGHFDQLGVEPGATPVILPEGILLVYNGWDDAHVHKTGWVLFSKGDPAKILARCEQPFIEPEFAYERPNAGHRFTFTEGVAFFQGLWRFYYGAADHDIGLAEMSDLASLLKPSAPANGAERPEATLPSRPLP